MCGPVRQCWWGRARLHPCRKLADPIQTPQGTKAPSLTAAQMRGQGRFPTYKRNQGTSRLSPGFPRFSSPVILLGVAAVSATPLVDAFACMPYRLSPYMQYEKFSDGSGGAKVLISGNTTQDGEFHYTNFMLSNATLQHSQATTVLDTPGILVYSQTPVMFVSSHGNSTLNAVGLAFASVAGTTGACAAGKGGGFGGAGGGSGGASTTNAGCTGGPHQVWWLPGTQVAGGTSGLTGGAGGAGQASNSNWVNGGVLPLSSRDLMTYTGGSGAPGAAGSGNGTNAGGASGGGGGIAMVKAPSINIVSGSTINCNGGAGSNGAPGGGGGGGGGGGTCGYAAGFSVNGTTGISAAGGGGGTGGVGAGAGGSGGAGNVVSLKLW
jgi:hypothetical protein